MERDTAAAVGVPPPGAATEDVTLLVNRLLAAYQDVLALAGARSGWFWVLPHHAWPFGRVKAARFRLLVPQFAAVHAARSARLLRRRLHAEAVGAGDPTLYSGEVALLERFESSLPGVPTRTLGTLLVVGMLGLSYGTARVLGGSADDVSPLRHLLGGVFTLSRGDVVAAVEQYHWQAVPIYFTAVGLTVSLWVLLLLPITSFRLKRVLFNVSPGRRLDEVEEIDPRSSRRGIYALERTLFERLGSAPPREVRFDLALDAALTVLVAIVAVELTLNVLHAPGGAGALLHGLVRPRNRHTVQLLGTLGLVVVSLGRLLGIVAISRGRTHRIEQRHARTPAAREAAILGPASWQRRLGALTLDLGLVYIVWLFALGALSLHDSTVLSGGDVGVAYAALLVLWLANVAGGSLGHGAYATPGKRALGLRVVAANGTAPSLRRALVRELVFKGLLFSPFDVLTLPVYLRPLWNDRRATWYDDWLGLRVVRVATEHVAEDAVALLVPS